MTKQQMFDRVWQHFVVEKGPPSGDLTRCNYRDPSGAKCAMGLLIPDEMYAPVMEGRPAYAVLAGWPELHRLLMDGFDDVPIALWDLCHSLQNCHDGAVAEAGSFHRDIEKRLRSMAKASSLAIPS